MTDQTSNRNPVEKAGKTYNRQMLIIMMVGYPIFLMGAITLIKQSPGAWWVPLMALVPMIPILFGLRAVLQFMERMDELQRQIQLTSLAIAAGGTSIVTMTYGFLDTLAGFPRLSWIWVFPVLCIFWVIGGFVARRQYA